ncbi:MAG: DNA topoisomerase IV subunit A [Rhodospirillaceae bacterium]|nr:DNA topoisomerase IV subunit A [Rhodospirillaceae bacterium]
MSTETILPIDLDTALGERYLSYALSTITARSLPDVRDGLKPVHRRLLFAMRQLALRSETPPKKSARVVGDVIGKYHPHGETAVYDALVRLAQDFAQRYPLIDGQGNFGNVDGDNAAAMRYTEARLTRIAELLLDGIDEDAVDFRGTYDGDGEEPVVLPAAFPNLLANGAQGIAVGMATSIPPHNAGELCAALLHLLRHPDAGLDTLLRFIPGPDFPTGGVLVEPRDTIREAYATGRGGFRLRARWEVERLAQGQYQIVVTEVPYQVAKSRLVERIATLITDRKVPNLADVRDESAEDIRLVLEPRARTVDPDGLMEQLFKHSELEVRVPLNLNVLDGGRIPKVMSLGQALTCFLDHRIEVLQRRTRHRLGKIAHRLEVLGGYLIAYLNLDEVIKIIREDDHPKQTLIARFKLTEVQADAILNLRLRALNKLQELEIRREYEELSAERDDLVGLLADEKRQRDTVADQIKQIRKEFGEGSAVGKRRTIFADPPSLEAADLEPQIEREPITVYLSQKGWIRAVRGHQTNGDVKYKDGDRERFVIHAETTDKLLLLATDGRVFTIPADRLPRGRGFGEPVRLMVDLANDADVQVVTLYRGGGRRLLVASSDGRGFVVADDDLLAQTKAGRQVLNVSTGAELALAVEADGDAVAVIGGSRKLLVFGLDEIPQMTKGKGVILQKNHGNVLTDAKVFRREDGLSWKMGERTRTESDVRSWWGKRGQTGRLPPRGFPAAKRLV